MNVRRGPLAPDAADPGVSRAAAMRGSSASRLNSQEKANARGGT